MRGYRHCSDNTGRDVNQNAAPIPIRRSGCRWYRRGDNGAFFVHGCAPRVTCLAMPMVAGETNGLFAQAQKC